MVKAKVASGEYATESEVIRDGLRTLVARDAALEKWLTDEVMPTIEAIDSGTMRAMPIEEARKRLRARIDALVGKASAGRNVDLSVFADADGP